MKGSISRLLFAMLAVSSAYAETVHYGKTYMLQRSQGVSLEKEYVTFHKHMHMSSGDRIGGSLQVVPFYQESSHNKDCKPCGTASTSGSTSDGAKYGKYFGRKNETSTVVSSGCDTGCANIEDWIGVSKTADAEALTPRQVFHISKFQAGGATEVIDFDANIVAAQTLKDRVQINPQSSSVGARFDYHQKLDALLEGLYFKLSVPVVNNKTNVNAKSIGDDDAQQLALALTDLNTPATALTGESKTFLQYLAGNVSSLDPANRQNALTKAKVVLCSRDVTGVADVDFVIGYNFLQEDTYHACLNIGTTFPTGTKTCGEYLFAPRVGTDHWGFGAGFETGVNIWSCDNCELELMLVGNYRYLFKDKEFRTASDGQFGHYKLGDKSDAKANDAFFPLANVLTQEWDVTPGSQFELLLNLSCTAWESFVFDLGYNFYYREKEKVEFRDCNLNALAKTGVANLDARADAAGSTNVVRVAPTVLTEEVLKEKWICAMETPRQLTHKIYASVGYVYNEWEYPVSGGVFGGYEFTDNAAMEQWHVGGKVGVSF